MRLDSPDEYLVQAAAFHIGRQIYSAGGEDDRTRPVDVEGDTAHDPRPAGAGAPFLLIIAGPRTGELYRVDGGDHVIGRGDDANIRVPDLAISRRHARVKESAGELLIEDLGSMNGTFRNGRRLERGEGLEDGDIITIGPVTAFKFTSSTPESEVFRQRMLQLGRRDRVTGTLQVEFLWDRLRAEFGFTARHGTPLALLVLDLDRFQLANEIFGNQAGDRVLRETAEVLRRQLRREDFVSRHVEDEFAVLCRGIPPAGALAVAERLRAAIGGYVFDHEGGATTIPITVSIGVVCAPAKQYATPDDLLNAARSAVMTAKLAGRNRVFLASEEGAP